MHRSQCRTSGNRIDPKHLAPASGANAQEWCRPLKPVQQRVVSAPERGLFHKLINRVVENFLRRERMSYFGGVTAADLPPGAGAADPDDAEGVAGGLKKSGSDHTVALLCN